MGDQNNFEEMVNHVAEKGGERVDAGTVLKAVDRLKSRFEVPKRAVERAMKSQVWMVNKDLFGQYTELYLESMGLSVAENFRELDTPKEIADVLGIDVEKMNKGRAEKLDKIRTHISATQGISLTLEDGGALVLINRDDCSDVDMAVTHELVHAMMDEKPGNYEEVDKCSRGGFSKRGLNEAAVQLITLCSLLPDRNVGDILKEISNGTMQTPYAKEINKLGLLIWGTSLNEDKGLHIGFDQVVKMYFDESTSPGEKKWLLKINIVRGLPDKAAGFDDFKKKGEMVFDSL